ncbi:MAG: hypothetical protein LBD20_07075 [Spirochaetaceae bacterium]|jgi:hypothetical protein|nr:hypothetical protein [Spirochaetaceae bacterium]
MGTIDLKTLIIEVLKSWQVLAVTIVVIMYWLIVFAAANPSKKKRKEKGPKPQKIKRPSTPATDLGKDIDDSELGLDD